MKKNPHKIFSALLFGLMVLFFFFATPIFHHVSADGPTTPAVDPLKKINFDTLNPLKIGNNQDITANPGAPPCDPTTSTNCQNLSNPGFILSRLFLFAIPAAGLILFVMIIWGGFEMLSGAATAKSQEAGKQRITAALIGFLLLFASYWIAQLIQVIFGVQFLN